MALTVNPTDPAPQQPIFNPDVPPTEPTPYPPDQPPEATTLPEHPISSPLPDPNADPDKHWQNYGVQAINQLYPWARNGVDFCWGRTEPGGDAHLLEWSENLAPADEAAIEEAARKLADADPYGPQYQPQPSLAGGMIRNAPDEVQPPPPAY